MVLGSYFYLLYISAFFILNVLILANFASSLQPSCFDHDRLALLNFKHSFQIDCASSPSPSFARPKLNSWTVSGKQDCCNWEGVYCDEETGQVIKLDLSSSCLYGHFPENSSIFGLHNLRELNLAFNNFNYSQIPSQIGNFHKLKSLNLSTSVLSGQIPLEISKLSELSLLDLSNDDYFPTYNTLNMRLHDPNIDKLLRNLTSLQILRLETVYLSSTFPTSLLNLTSLTELSLQLCNIYGDLPPKLFLLPHLEVLNLAGNVNLAGSLPKFQWHNPLKILILTLTSLSAELPPSIGKLPHLESLKLESCQLTGFLPSSLNNLSTLTKLALDGNNFQGDIPFSLMNLTNLELLGLSDLNVNPGQLFSQLPKLHKLTTLVLTGMKLESEILSLLANFTRLQELFLGDTNLKGPFPNWLANLTQLNELYLRNNDLMGPIPQWVSHLTNLTYLQLAGNNLLGKFETFLQLKNLIYLDLSGNNIIFPPILGNNASLLQLQFLGISGCNLTKFPQVLQLQKQLQILLLSMNNIIGSIPQWFINVTKDSLFFIDLSSNNLTGFEKPSVVLPWNNLVTIDLSYNKFQGKLLTPPNSMVSYIASSNLFKGAIPKKICNARYLQTMDFSNNMLSGKIPHCIASQLGGSLQMLDLRRNSLTGIIPSGFIRSCKVKMINLSNNELGGNLPKSLLNCSMLEELDIGRNRVIGTFPSWLGSLPKLQVLVLNHNRFNGRIAYPQSGHDFRMLRIIDLSSNFHNGDLPSRYIQNWHEMDGAKENQSDSSNIKIDTFLPVGQDGTVYQQKMDYSVTITNKGNEQLYTKILKVFRVMDFSSNNFTGTIPDIIGNLHGLQALNLSNNNLHGRIPPSLANITDLESLDLSSNMLSGEIPLALSQLTFLEVFNVSFNRLEGSVPTENQFSTFDNSSYQGNLGLCGPPLSKECSNDDAPRPPPQGTTKDGGSVDSNFIDWMIRSIGFLGGCIVGYVIGNLYITDKYHEWFMKTFGKQRQRRRVMG